MDQVNAFMKIAKRHYFWFLTAVVVLGGLGTWFYATGQLRAEYDENKSTIESTMSQIRAIKGEANHPNTSSEEQMQDRINVFSQEVHAVWQTLYQNQRKNTLVWPEELREDFIRAVDEKRPVEASIDYPTPDNQKLSANFTERYRDYIKQELPKLAETIGSKWVPSASGGSSVGGGREGGGFRSFGGKRGEGGTSVAAPEEELLVIWNPENQSQLQQERFDWSTKPGKVPSTLEVHYTQEDLWVLQTIMDIVARTNGDATAHHRATIKQIESIHMGRNAVGLVGKVQRLESRIASDDFFGGEASVATEGNPTAIPEQRGEGGAGVATDPADFRYVDPENKPIPATELRTALRDNSPEKAFLSVAKRLPVRIRVIMDQRKVPKLLAECGSAPLTIEVRQVRVNREQGGSNSFQGFSGRGRGEGSSGGSGSSAVDASSTYDIPVEIYGVVYIFNPPNKDILKLSESQKADAAAAVVPQAQPPIAGEQPAEPEPEEPAEPAPAAPQPAGEAPAEPADAPAAPAAGADGGAEPAGAAPPAEN